MGWFWLAFETMVRLAVGHTGGMTKSSRLLKNEVPAILSKRDSE